MTLRDDIEQENGTLAKADMIRLRRERDLAQHEVVRLQTQLDQANRALSVVSAAELAELQPPHWLTPTKPKSSAATLVVMLSDTHFDEVVIPEEVEGLNAYNRDIATKRLHKWATNVVKISRHYLAGVDYDGCVLL